MDVGRAISGPFKDPKWVGKAALGALILMVPILNFAVAGFGMDYLRNVAEGRDYELPSWNDIGSQIGRGFLWMVASLIVMVPGFLIILVGVGGSGAIFGGAASSMSSSSSGVAGALAAFFMGILTVLLIALVYWLVVSILLRAMFAQYAMTRRFGSIFQIGDIFSRLKYGYWSAWILGILVVFGFLLLWFIFVAVLAAIPCIGWLLSLVLIPVGGAVGIMIGLMSDHLLGQYAARAYAVSPGETGYAPPGLPSYPAGPTPGAYAGSVGSGAALADQGAPPAPPAVTDAAATSAPDAVTTMPPASLAGSAAIAAAVARAGASKQPAESARAGEARPSDDEDSAASPTGASRVVGPGSAPARAAKAEDIVASTKDATGAPSQPPAPPAPSVVPEGDSGTGPATPPPMVTQPLPPVVPVVTPTPPAMPSGPPAPGRPTVIEGAVANAAPSAPRAGGPATLRVVSGGPLGSRWVLPAGESCLGRDDSCLVKLDDERASRRHARIVREGSGFVLSDLGSSNGTLVNGSRVSGIWPLADGDLIQIGDTVLSFSQE